MDTLFRLPKIPEYKRRTASQPQMLDLVALYEGQPLTQPLRHYGFTRRLLRRVIDAKLVEVIAMGPGRYALTPFGRIVRTNARRTGYTGEMK